MPENRFEYSITTLTQKVGCSKTFVYTVLNDLQMTKEDVHEPGLWDIAFAEVGKRYKNRDRFKKYKIAEELNMTKYQLKKKLEKYNLQFLDIQNETGLESFKQQLEIDVKKRQGALEVAHQKINIDNNVLMNEENDIEKSNSIKLTSFHKSWNFNEMMILMLNNEMLNQDDVAGQIKVAGQIRQIQDSQIKLEKSITALEEKTYTIKEVDYDVDDI